VKKQGIEKLHHQWENRLAEKKGAMKFSWRKRVRINPWPAQNRRSVENPEVANSGMNKGQRWTQKKRG